MRSLQKGRKRRHRRTPGTLPGSPRHFWGDPATFPENAPPPSGNTSPENASSGVFPPENTSRTRLLRWPSLSETNEVDAKYGRPLGKPLDSPPWEASLGRSPLMGFPEQSAVPLGNFSRLRFLTLHPILLPNWARQDKRREQERSQRQQPGIHYLARHRPITSTSSVTPPLRHRPLPPAFSP